MINHFKKVLKLKIFLIIFILTIIIFSCCFKLQTVPTSSSELDFEKGENSVLFIGHSTTLIHLNGVNILTDPNFNNWLTIFRRLREAGVRIENLPPIDVILISHPHRDHLDKWTIEQFPKNIPVYISKGNGKYLRKWGFTNIYEFDVWETKITKGIKITAAPAQHSGARNSPWAEFPEALGYIVQGEVTVYFAGDTGLFEGFKEIGNHSQIDMALLPIGAYSPRWFMKGHHMGPDDVVNAMAMLKAKEMIPIHWGSFKMALDGIDEPKEALLELIENSSLKEKIHILENGEKFILSKE